MNRDRDIVHHATEFIDDVEAVALEDTLWWCVGRRAILRRYLVRADRETPLSQILEVGCGSGGHLSLLSQYGNVTAVEQSEVLAKRARSRNVAKRVYVGDCLELEFPQTFQMVCLFDVLEHLEDDEAFLAQLDRIGRPGHWLLLSVPACQFLYGPHDEVLHHYRRYSRSRLEGVLKRSGYQCVRGSHFLFFLFPIAVLSRFMERLRGLAGRKQTTVELGVVPRWVNTLLVQVLKLEGAISQFIPLPIGVWYIVLAKKT